MKLFDTHCDTAVRCYNNFQPGGVKTPLADNPFHISLKHAAAFEQYTQFFAIWDDDAMEPEEGYGFFQFVYDNFLQELQKNQPQAALCTAVNEMGQTQTSALLAVENGKLLNGRMERLEHLYTKGVRLMTLTWNGSNCIGHGMSVPEGGGLTAFGKEAVRKMNDMGMVVDVSHLNDQGFYDVARVANAPMIASHSNSRAVCNHLRNLTDDQIHVLCASRGLIGLNFSTHFLSESPAAAYEDLLHHIYHMLDLGAEDVLCLGADFDGTDVPAQLEGLSKMEDLYVYLKSTDLGCRLTDKIFYENAFQFFKNML